MKLLKITFKRIVLIIVMLSILITFLATPASYAKLDLQEGDFYYSGTTEGRYAPSKNIFSWLLSKIGDIADWLVGIITFGFRMVFIGWTALFEKLLTWALESTTGVSADGSLVESSTDLTSLSDSSGNITVEAIVYNRVPALSADIFDLDFDRTRSGTGKKMICEDCEKPVEECKASATMENVDDESKTKCEAIDETDSKTCDCNGCASCTKYLAQLKAKEPLIIQLRKLVATWYTIMRLLSVAAMLVVLIAVGIKMALSTIASDKAVYKRMLVDWVIGMIIIFAIHYFMIFVIHMNNVLVDVIEKSAQSVNKVSLMQINGGEETEVANEELEIKIYEEVRTRAYDPKLSNGLIGMVMYMTLVFFAFKYTIIYIKRLLTIIVLTLMAPPVGVAYALQKVLSGKSATLKTWMTEYIMNMIIQVVHALMYAIFISQALVLSLQNVSGMLFALILMNYTSKADELFKKIFKFGGGDSLLGHTEGALEASMQSLQSAQGMIMGAKPVAKALTNTPYGKAVKAVGKTAVAAAVGVTGGIATAIGDKIAAKNEEYDNEYQNQLPKVEKNEKGEVTEEAFDAHSKQLEDTVSGIRNGSGYWQNYDGKPTQKVENQKMLDRALLDTDPAKLESELKAAQEAFKKADKTKDPKDFNEKKMALQRAYNNSARFAKLTTATQGKIALAHAEKAFEIRNEFKLRHSLGNTSKPEGKVKKIGRTVGSVMGASVGTMNFDSRNWKMVKHKDAIYNRFNSENLLGFTADDKKMFKQHVMTPIMHGFIGMGSLFFGMATVVANPKMGMALLATGSAYTRQTFRRPTGVKASEGRYTFSRYGTLTMNAIKNSAIQQARRERRGLTAKHLETTRPKFVDKLKAGKLSAVTLGIAFAPVLLPSYVIRHPINSTANVVNTIKNYKDIPGNTKEYFGKVKKEFVSIPERASDKMVNLLERADVAIDNAADSVLYAVEHPGTTMKNAAMGTGKAMKDGAVFLTDQTIGRFVARTALADHLEAIDNHSMIQQRKQEAEFKEDAVKMMDVQAAAVMERLEREEEERQLIQIYAACGFTYDPKTKMITANNPGEIRNIPDENKIKESDINKDSSILTADPTLALNTINVEIDRAILELASSGSIDMTSKGLQSKTIKLVEDRLKSAGIIKDGQDVKLADLLKGGESELTKSLKLKAATMNSRIEDAKKSLNNEDLERHFEKIFEEQFGKKEGKEKGKKAFNEYKNDINEIVKIVSDLAGENSTKISKEDKINGMSGITVDDVISRLKATGGSKEATATGDQIAIYDDIRVKDQIGSYIKAVTRTTTEGMSASEVKKEANRIAKDKKQKLQQVLAVAIDHDLNTEGNKNQVAKMMEGEERNSDDVLAQLLSKKQGEQTVAGLELTAEEYNVASRMVENLLERKAINQIAVKDLDIKKGTSGYKKAKNKKSDLTLKILNDEKSLQTNIDKESSTTNKDEKEKLKTTITKIREDIEKNTKELEKVNQSLKSNTIGPISDIDKLLRNEVGRR